MFPNPNPSLALRGSFTAVESCVMYEQVLLTSCDPRKVVWLS